MADIRRLEEEDRAAWRALRLALWPREDSTGFDRDITEILDSGDKLAAYGLFEGADLIGFLEVGERPWGDGCETAPVGWVEGIYVDPEHRRQGHGLALVAQAREWARQRGYRELGSDVRAENETSLRSHDAWGFEETKRLVMFRMRL